MRYIFQVTLIGEGEDPDEAWNDAVEGFTQDPGWADLWDYEEEEDE